MTINSPEHGFTQLYMFNEIYLGIPVEKSFCARHCWYAMNITQLFLGYFRVHNISGVQSGTYLPDSQR